MCAWEKTWLFTTRNTEDCSSFMHPFLPCFFFLKMYRWTIELNCCYHTIAILLIFLVCLNVILFQTLTSFFFFLLPPIPSLPFALPTPLCRWTSWPAWTGWSYRNVYPRMSCAGPFRQLLDAPYLGFIPPAQISTFHLCTSKGMGEERQTGEWTYIDQELERR